MTTMLSCLLAVLVIADCGFILTSVAADNTIVFDDSTGYGRAFDGIGGISGGGATSKLLVNYPKQLRDEILDYLFLPNFGASLQILKVEIGGDVQSTDGSEASHMHYPWDENYQRGYEWWLMLEAKKRNPDIKLYALSWGFPAWVGLPGNGPYYNISVLADYVVRWINGAKEQYGLTIDYVGIWNEKDYSVPYIKLLRQILDQRGFENVLIVAADGGWGFADELKDPDLAKAVYAVGCHYPGTYSDSTAVNAGNALWASEDYSTFNDETGAGCWARILNRNYVNGYMTATIAWDLIASYYDGLPYFRDGLMTAVQPWSGNYVVQSPIWVSAHTTQFTSIGWKYLNHNSGVGTLPNGGTYVGLVSPTGSDLTIIIETMTHDHSICIRPGLDPYSVDPQNVTIALQGRFAGITQLYVWHSQLGFNGVPSSMFNNLGLVKVINGTVQLSLGLDEIYTLTTLSTGLKGSYPLPPDPRPFPLPYYDDFEGYQLYQEPYNLAQQTGSFEVLKSGENQFIRQMVLTWPITWCDAETVNKAINIIGNISWTDTLVEIDFNIPNVNATDGVFVAARISGAGCDIYKSNGIFLFVMSDLQYHLVNNPFWSTVITSGTVPSIQGWHRISLFVQGNKAYGAYDGNALFNVDITNYSGNGFAGIGTNTYGLADFDNLYIAPREEGIAKMERYFQEPLPKPLYFINEHN